MTNFLSALSPLSLLVLLVFLFAIALVVALWSLLTLGSSPRALAVVRPRKARTMEIKPLPSNRFMKQKAEEEKVEEALESELPTNHVSRSRVRILKTLEPDPELETPAFKPTTYDQMVNRQRVPKKNLPKVNLPKTGLPSLTTGLPKQAREIGAPKAPLREANRLEPTVVRTSQPPAIQPPLPTPLQVPTPPTPPLRTNTEDTSTQPALFDTGRSKRTIPPKPVSQQAPVEPEPPLQAFRQVPRKPSVQREESEAAFRASQGLETKSSDSESKPKTQKEKDEAFENFLRKNDDLSF